MKLIRNVLILAAFYLASSTVMAQTAPVIAIVDLDRALLTTEAFVALEAQMELDFAEDDQRLQRLDNQMQELQARYQRDQSTMSETELARLEADAQEIQVQHRLVSERLEAQYDQRVQRFVNSQRENLRLALDAVVEEEGFDIVLHAGGVIYFKNPFNATASVTAKLNELNNR